jgi:hypothetical protein
LTKERIIVYDATQEDEMKIYRYLVILVSSLILVLVLPSLLPGLKISANTSPEISSTTLFGPVLSLEYPDDYAGAPDSSLLDGGNGIVSNLMIKPFYEPALTITNVVSSTNFADDSGNEDTLTGSNETWTQHLSPTLSSISGQVATSNYNPIAGVTISSSTGLTTTTDANGNYTFNNLQPGSYTLTPTKSGCTFSPASLTVSVPPNATSQNFTGTCGSSPSSITGQVITSNNSPISGVIITSNTGLTTTTDATGNYTVSNLQPGSYTLTPTKSSCTFSPASRIVSVPPNATGQNFTGTCASSNSGTLVGIIYHTRTGQRIAGANVTACTGAKLVTDARGFYRFDNLPVGLCRVTAAKAGYQDGFRDGQVVAGETRWNSIALEPTATQVGTLIGIIYDTKTGRRLARATVTACTGEQVESDFYGFYRFINLSVGTCRVTATKSGYQTNFRDGLVIANAVRWNSIGLRLLTSSTGVAADTMTLADDRVANGGTINIFDLAFISSHYSGDDPTADLNIDGTVDIIDLVIAANNFHSNSSPINQE